MKRLHPEAYRLASELPMILNRGEGFAGPEAYGCINSGTRPSILRASVGPAYYVGPELEVTDKSVRAWFRMNPSVRKHGRCWRFRSRTAAVNKWRELVSERVYQNERLAAEHAKAAADARSSDYQTALQGALAMGDF